MTLLEAIKQAGRYRINPTYSLFHTSANGEYTLILRADNPKEVADRFVTEALKPETVGLEVRCDGMRVDA